MENVQLVRDNGELRAVVEVLRGRVREIEISRGNHHNGEGDNLNGEGDNNNVDHVVGE